MSICMIGLEALARVRFRPGTAAGDAERYRPVRMAKSEMQCCEGAHGQTADMGLRDAEMVEYGQDVVRRTVLAIGLGARRDVRRGIAARRICDRTVTPPEMPQPRLPTAMISGELMDEDERRAAQPVGAHVPSWCSRHEVDAGCSRRAGPPGQLTTHANQTSLEGTGWTPPRRP